jgi:ribosome biogenesis GTPase / thiamine phosphate phosphatase
MSTSDHNQNDLGVIFKKTVGNYEVYTSERMLPCTLSTRLRKQFVYPSRHSDRQVKLLDDTDLVAVGDQVRFVDSQDGTGMITEILPRRNHLSRQTSVPMPDALPFEQVIVANIDQVVPVFSAASPTPHWNMLDRYLVAAEERGLPCVICITKLDLADSKNTEFWDAIADYRRIGYPVVLVSADTGEGLEDIKHILQAQTSVLLGKSGVGKSSLLNALQPGLGLRVNEVSRVKGRGKHTTTYLEMFPLSFGGAVVDTPGSREFGLWDVNPDDLDLFFPEMRPYLGQCRFGLDCQHVEEPGCAIRQAVTAEDISPRRYSSFIRLRNNP